jgi:RND family efflux transporter MFP subunit
MSKFAVLLLPCFLALAGAGRCTETVPIAADVTTCLAKPKQVIQLGGPVFGILAEVFVDRTDVVKRGQLVAKLDTTVEEAQVALDRFRAKNTTQIEAAQTDLAWNERELARRQKLADIKFARMNETDEIATKVEQDRIAIRKAEVDLKTAALEADRSESQLKLKMIKSPVDGVVTEIKLMPGEFINETTPIMTIAQIDPLSVDVVLPAERYKAVKVGLTAELRLYAPVDDTFEATVDAVDPIIDAASDTFRVRLALPNPGNAIPAGVRCSVRLPDVTVSGN